MWTKVSLTANEKQYDDSRAKEKEAGQPQDSEV